MIPLYFFPFQEDLSRHSRYSCRLRRKRITVFIPKVRTLNIANKYPLSEGENHHSSHPMKIRISTILILFVAVLLSTGCTDSSSRTALANQVTFAPSPDLTDPGSDTCTIEHLVGNADLRFAREVSCYFRTHTPIDFLNDLRLHPHHPVMVIDVPDGWITPQDAELLVQVIDSDEPAAPVVSPISSYRPFNQTSTVGNEALFLLEGYRTGKYPPSLCSLHYFTPNRTEMRSWWESYGQHGLIDEKEAIGLVRERYPDLLTYPSDGLPPRSIKTEQTPGGWYIAFIQEGSGLPILSARCYFVSNNRTIRLTGTVNQSMLVLPRDFSAQRCGL